MENISQEERALQKEEDRLRCIEILKRALRKFRIPERYVSIGGYAEEAICLEKVESGFMVYGGERGENYNSKIHVDCEEACLDILSRLADSVEEEKEWIDFLGREYESTFQKINRPGKGL